MTTSSDGIRHSKRRKLSTSDDTPETKAAASPLPPTKQSRTSRRLTKDKQTDVQQTSVQTQTDDSKSHNVVKQETEENGSDIAPEIPNGVNAASLNQDDASRSESPTTKRKRGRPPKSAQTSIQHKKAAEDESSAKSAGVNKRRSGRFQPDSIDGSPTATEHEPDVKKPELAKETANLDEAAETPGDTRKRHANGRPMGRPRKSDLNGATSTDIAVVDLKTKHISPPSPDSLDKRKRSAAGKPLGRPRKRELSTEEPNSTTKQSTTKSLARNNKQSKEALTSVEAPSVKGLKKIRLRFGTGPAEPIVTNPLHIPPKPVHESLQVFLASFVSLDEDVNPDVAAQRRIDHEQLRKRVATAQSQGLLDKAEKPKLVNLRADEPQISQSHQDFLNNQAAYFSKLMQDERRRNYSNARKIAGMIQAHFRRLSGADERQTLESQRAMRQLAKRIANEVRRKWRLAEKEVQRRLASKIQEEQRIAGKEHLNKILDHSTSLLDAQFSTQIEEETFSDDVSEGNEDHYLSVEELRVKYANLPELEEASDVDSDVEAADSAEQSDASDGSQASTSRESAEEIESLHVDSDDALDAENEENEEEDVDDGPMDSEFDTASQQSDETGASEGPGLAFLYPELAIARSTKSSDLSLVPMEDTLEETEDQAMLEESINDLPKRLGTTRTNDTDLLPKRLGTTRTNDTDLVALPSDEESDEDESDHSPMDSEMDETDDSNTDDEVEEGPGLSWLYSTPMPAKTKAPVIENETPERKIESASELNITSTSKVMPEEQAEEEEVDHTSIKTPIPFLLRGTLREYQHMGLDWMAGLYLNGTNGILADEMGLGKTIQTISLLTWLACEREIWGTHLIVVPTSVMLNWEMEFKKFAPALKVLTYYGSPKERKEKRKGWSRPDTVHIVITSYQLVITDAAVFRRKRWEYLILDEAHNIKNFKSQRWQTLLNFNTQHRLLLTGTPLQNNLNELWSLLYFLMPQGLSDNTSFANLSDFQEWFARPVDKLIEDAAPQMDEEARNTIAKLHRILRPYILRRLKADVEKQMPGKYEHVITCKLSKRQRFLYDDFMSRSGTRAIMASGNFLSIINCFMQLRKVCNHPDLFESRPIVTSFAMRKSAVAAFEIKELLVRRHLLARDDQSRVDLDFLNFDFKSAEKQSKTLATTIAALSRPVEITNDSLENSSMSDSEVTISTKRSLLDTTRRQAGIARDVHFNYISTLRSAKVPIYGMGFLNQVREVSKEPLHDYWNTTSHIKSLCPDLVTMADLLRPIVTRFTCIPPKVVALDLPQQVVPLPDVVKSQIRSSLSDATYFARTSTSIAFPDKRLLQFDCGKLQRLDGLLRELIAGGHRVLIFTQMTKMLDILEQFLNIHGHRYFRLDGSTKIESRQSLTERFNKDTRIPVFILSTRSGGLGINLTGADTVIFYDSDWNPCMDRQCQDRAHRIGQTRDVHIYRFVSEYTIEQNIMRKANQKRMLDNVVIGEGDFTTDFFNKVDWRDMLGDELSASVSQPGGADIENALAAAEDEDDAQAAKLAQREMDVDAVEFAETGTAENKEHAKAVMQSQQEADEGEEEEEEPGSIDDYMIAFLEREMGVSA